MYKISYNYLKKHFRHKPKTYDRTDLVRRALRDHSITKATVYIDYTTILGIKWAGKRKPGERSPKAIVEGWHNGWELARRSYGVGRMKNWYWVKYPARLRIERPLSASLPGPLRDLNNTLKEIPVVREVMKSKLTIQIVGAVIAGFILYQLTKTRRR
ncbi:MAG TPA: hypothetical protein EYH22_01840 [Candidatus Nanopusillus sp.]|nr:hypothetical protein [Candidatus Nanopusillus sp.]